MSNPDNNAFPDHLMIRNTPLYDDIGGAGRRIYTTAGQGREKRKYIRADLATPVVPAWSPIESAPKDRQILLWGRYWTIEQGWMKEPLIGMWNNRTNRWVVFSHVTFGIHPTLWMPLPAAPSPENKT